MRILTIGDSWTYGVDSSDPATKSWPAQMAKKYGVEVVNLARGGSSNQRAARIAMEEVCQDSNFDWIIFPLAPAPRTEVLNMGKWHQVWPHKLNRRNDVIEDWYSNCWHPWNDLQNTINLSFWFIHAMKSFVPNIYITGLSIKSNMFRNELSWIMDYRNDYDFRSLGIPIQDFNIGIKDMDRKLKKLKAIHLQNLSEQPEYLVDSYDGYYNNAEIQQKYQYNVGKLGDHPDDNGYHALCDFFAKKIGLC